MLDKPIARDIALLLIRVVVGTIFIAHGWHKLFIQGLGGEDGLIADFAHHGIPQPQMSAWVATILELLGGAFLVLGLLAPLVSGLLILHMLAAMYLVHWSHGLFAAEGGVEFPLTLCTSLLIVLVFGAGRISLDRGLSRFA